MKFTDESSENFDPKTWQRMMIRFVAESCGLFVAELYGLTESEALNTEWRDFYMKMFSHKVFYTPTKKAGEA